MPRDIFAVQWPNNYELCPDCGQPDNCGDCNHNPLTSEQVKELGGIISNGRESTMAKNKPVRNRVAEAILGYYDSANVTQLFALKNITSYVLLGDSLMQMLSDFLSNEGISDLNDLSARAFAQGIWEAFESVTG